MTIDEFCEKWILSRVYVPFPDKKRLIMAEMKADLGEMLCEARGEGVSAALQSFGIDEKKLLHGRFGIEIKEDNTIALNHPVESRLAKED